MGQGFTVHVAPQIAWQARYAKAFKQGLECHGYAVRVTGDVSCPGDVHVLLGPHYAYRRWRHDVSILVDRAYWGDPDRVSIHWLVNGEKHYGYCLDPRAIPECQPWRDSQKTIYLCDYGAPPRVKTDAVRWHPSERPGGTLAEALAGHGVAYGHRTTALVDACISGLVVYSSDPHSPVARMSGRRSGRERWLTALAWHNWHIDEISTGEFLNGIGHSHPRQRPACHVGRG